MIEKLTKKQIDLLPVYQEKWLKMLSSVGETDKDNVEKYIHKIYRKIIKLRKPELIVYTDSPKSCLLASSMLKEKLKFRGEVDLKIQLRMYANDIAASQVNGDVWVKVDGGTGKGVFDRLREMMMGDLS